MNTHLIKKLTLPSIVIWLAPFLVSMMFYDRNGQMVGEYWVFKVTMILCATIAACIMLRTFFKDNPKVGFFPAAIVIFLFQLILDVIVLIGIFKMSPIVYLMTVLPVYVVIIPLTCYILSRLQRKK